ncbi:MAG: MBL fold metallo-hydrolase [Planctomycetaceae bacterium]|jgi:glyoxylase-like metal-dependent hydrolase (beta-lactamase superfamily II)|nr:MBL fold metallo-hydrolase [Planctomycetaceae bacterium]
MKIVFYLVMFMMCGVSVLSGQTGDGGGCFKIVAVNEMTRTMETSLFASADPAVVKQYIPKGAPASMSSFVLFAGGEPILFDTGLGGEAWVKKLADLGVKPESVKLILLTHLHSDHVGGLLDGTKSRFPNAVVRCSEPEYQHWLPKNGQPKNKQVGTIQSVYGKRFAETFRFGDEVFSNVQITIKALDAAGHTPGHTAFLIEAKKPAAQRFLIAGDLLHAAALQFPKPDICTSYDMEPDKAVQSRKRILDFAVREDLLIGGMHFPPPNTGKVRKNDAGGYSFAPAD